MRFRGDGTVPLAGGQQLEDLKFALPQLPVGDPAEMAFVRMGQELRPKPLWGAPRVTQGTLLDHDDGARRVIPGDPAVGPSKRVLGVTRVRTLFGE